MAATRTPTSKDVANLAGVSQTTVSYVLNGKGNISAKTVRKVERAIAELNYQPHLGARALKGQKTSVLGLIVQLDESTVAADALPYIDAIVRTARRNDYDVVLSTQSGQVEDIQRLAHHGICDGLILMDIKRKDPRVALAAELSIPVILMGRTDGIATVDSVDINTYDAGRLAVEAAAPNHQVVIGVGEGGQRLAEFRFISDFYEGMETAAKEYGLDYHPVQLTNTRFESLSRELSPWIAQAHEQMTAFIVRAPEMVSDLLTVLRTSGLKVGQEVSVIGYCTDMVATQFEPPLANIAPALEHLANVVVEQLLRRVNKGTLPVSTTLVQPRELVIRSSLKRDDPTSSSASYESDAE
ncbi:LacI family DNA-binding transcriptional regulator [Trueperella pyogenes]|uniref:LacI family DNA-binding transcriptional regulator n=1 Tax=Trueperella pyogenes TaxID=1661 RepID=UPI000E05AD7D|nr:LacI family DNA-binding transcriptional regulator [Trueperella pyogenes]MBB3025575.1 DNA-binding LacI/PurR family transcriptional regulator [Trueperella pyogenes]SUO86451.1 Maltose operon transcriptional repressor [Trueperella pyogenes]